VTLDDLLGDLWQHGIPVVAIEKLPTPSFQGAAFVVEGRPIIVIGQKHDEPGRVAFFIAHEAGHVAAGDCQPGQPVVDEEDEVLDEADLERKADTYARCVLVGGDAVPPITGDSYKQLASNASQVERESGADASIAIFAWASRTGDYATASMAVKALYRGSGAKRKLREHLERHVDFEAATESDRALLRCVSGELADAAAP
jgi:Zn-dependent peptidase ImmA (M78 family)